MGPSRRLDARYRRAARFAHPQMADRGVTRPTRLPPLGERRAVPRDLERGAGLLRLSGAVAGGGDPRAGHARRLSDHAGAVREGVAADGAPEVRLAPRL